MKYFTRNIGTNQDGDTQTQTDSHTNGDCQVCPVDYRCPSFRGESHHYEIGSSQKESLKRGALT